MDTILYKRKQTIINQGGGNFATLVNAETALLESGYYYANNLSSDINLNAEGLISDKKILFFNDSNKNVVFIGLTSIDGVNIPANKGVKIAPSNYIEFTVTSIGSITKTRGNHTIDWKAGYTPPYQTFTYDSNGTSGLIYHLGATKYNSSFINPVTRGELNTSASSWLDVRTPDKAFDRAFDYDTTMFSSSWQGEQWIEFSLSNNRVMKITGIELWASFRDATGTWELRLANPSYLQAWNGTSWIDIFTFSVPSVNSLPSNKKWYSGFTNDNFYSRYRIVSNISYTSIGDIELYGDAYI